MKLFPLLLEILAAGQLAIAVLNLFLVRLMKWDADVARMPLLIREVFRVHAWFISVTLGIFGVLTWRFAGEMANGTNPIGTWLCVGIGIFWAIRTVLQVTYYSSSHWKGQPGRTLAHITLLFCYGTLAVVYFLCGCACIRGTNPSHSTVPEGRKIIAQAFQAWVPAENELVPSGTKEPFLRQDGSNTGEAFGLRRIPALFTGSLNQEEK